MSGGADLKGDARSSLQRLTGAATLPYRAATSKQAQRVYVSGILLALGTLILFCISTLSFIVLYYSYIPDVGITRVVHLQFGQGHPYGTVDFGSTLITQQPYDIWLTLSVPRTPANLATGNFMVDMALYRAEGTLPSPVDLLQFATSPNSHAELSDVTPALMRSRRPAILTHTSTIVETAHTLTWLPLYVLGWKRQSEKLEISMFESVQFSRGRVNVPARAQIVIEADEKMQFYDATVRIRAKLGGLRKFLYKHRILSFMGFTSGFFMVSVVSLLLAYIALGFFGVEIKSDGGKSIKEEEDVSEAENSDIDDPLSTAGLSDTSRQFPTRRGQPPLKYSGSGGRFDEDVPIKQEEFDEPAGIYGLTAEADDEDDEAGASSSWRDSGIGTGRESEPRGIQRRRKSSREGEF